MHALNPSCLLRLTHRLVHDGPDSALSKFAGDPAGEFERKSAGKSARQASLLSAVEAAAARADGVNDVRGKVVGALDGWFQSQVPELTSIIVTKLVRPRVASKKTLLRDQWMEAQRRLYTAAYESSTGMRQSVLIATYRGFSLALAQLLRAAARQAAVEVMQQEEEGEGRRRRRGGQ